MKIVSIITKRSQVSEYRSGIRRDLQISKGKNIKRSVEFSVINSWNEIPDNIREKELMAHQYPNMSN